MAIVLAYLLEWPNRAPAIYWLLRRWATSIVLVVFVGILLLMAFVVLPIAATGHLLNPRYAGDAQ